ncbi:hypothetical protein GCM10008957_47930 [Deinococcus ruber]|uniref:Uncharacterized protein n=1 Tax=Deinococcus ruber TaxID=1848197 RepID=A0A918CME4_9DEIO|nr:hypothetical protein GCM10008957_47930 [Deinococcus ruber]
MIEIHQFLQTRPVFILLSFPVRQQFLEIDPAVRPHLLGRKLALVEQVDEVRMRDALLIFQDFVDSVASLCALQGAFFSLSSCFVNLNLDKDVLSSVAACCVPRSA